MISIPKGPGQEKRGKEDSNRDFDPQGARTGEQEQEDRNRGQGPRTGDIRFSIVFLPEF